MPEFKDVIEHIKPQWKFRRVYIAILLTFLCLILSVLLGTSVWLGFAAKFSIYICTFFIVFTICSFMTLIGIIGSYIFGSRWETSDFLKTLPDIIPKLGEEK